MGGFEDFDFERRATTARTFSTFQLPKVVRTCCLLNVSISTCASRHNGTHFFDISTSKSAPDLVYFVYFDFEIYFAPQRRTLFRRLNFQKCSGRGVLCLFLLRNMLCPTNGARFFAIATSKNAPDLVYFVHCDLEMCFAPQRHAISHLSSGQLAPRPPL